MREVRKEARRRGREEKGENGLKGYKESRSEVMKTSTGREGKRGGREERNTGREKLGTLEGEKRWIHNRLNKMERGTRQRNEGRG